MDSMVDHKTRTLIAKVVAKCFSVRRVKVTGFDMDSVITIINKGVAVIITAKPLPFRKKINIFLQLILFAIHILV